GTTEFSLSSAKPLSPVSREHLIAAASVIGDRLENLAMRRDGDVSWIGLGLGGKDTWSIQPLGINLYDGVPGVALFLGYLGAVTKEPRYIQLAQAAMAGVSRKLSRVKPFIDKLGAFDGWGGVIYTLAQLGCLWEQPSLLL